MKNNTITIILVVLVVGGIVFMMSSDKAVAPTTFDVSQMRPTQGGMMHGMMEVSSDEEFILGMIPHHQEAIDTANEVLERGGEIPEVKELAQNIIEAQEREVAMMKEWYEDWYGEPFTDPGTYQPMMRDLSSYSGTDLDLVFTYDMIMHHMGALHMAGSLLQFTQRPELVELGNNILETQREEIILMQQILRDNQ